MRLRIIDAGFEYFGLHDLGKIAPGYTADMVVLNGEFDTVMTIIDGELRYQA